MALKFHFKKRSHGVMLSSGRIYKFAYSAYEHDPAPLIIFLYYVSGNHPRTKREWRFIQAINLNYISRASRRQFVEKWVNTLYTTRSTKVTWDRVKAQFPEIAFATRRYFYSPSYYIRGLKAIALEDVEKTVVGSLVSDYSNRMKIGFWSKMRKVQRTFTGIMDRRRR